MDTSPSGLALPNMTVQGQVDALCDAAWNEFQGSPPERRIICGIGGIPGSGKTTIAKYVTQELNARHNIASGGLQPPIAIFVPMDGFHFTRAQLDAMPDPGLAHARRGAEFTFDGEEFLRLVKQLRLAGNSPIKAPSFDHEKKDPVPDDIEITPQHRIIIIEGNYVLLDQSPWNDAASMFDLKWFVEVPIPVAEQRLIARHVEAGIVKTAEEALQRALNNDIPNGQEILKKRLTVDGVVHNDGEWENRDRVEEA